FLAVEQLAKGERTADEWSASCARWNLQDASLVPPAIANPPPLSKQPMRRLEPSLDVAPTFVAANVIPAGITLAVAVALWLSGKPWLPEAERELNSLRASCDRGDARSCHNLAVLHAEGN